MSRIKVERPLGKLREGDYPGTGDQLGALWKIVAVLVRRLPPGALADIPQDALDELARVEAVKARFPKVKPKRGS